MSKHEEACNLFVVFTFLLVWFLTATVAVIFGVRLKRSREYVDQLTVRVDSISEQITVASESARDLSIGLGGSINTVQDLIGRIRICKEKAEDLEKCLSDIKRVASGDSNNLDNME